MPKKPSKKSQINVRVMEYELCLTKLYGVVVSGKVLRHLLGYRTGDAFRQAVHRNSIPFPTFILKGRRERMARTHDVALWLASLDSEIEWLKESEEIEGLNNQIVKTIKREEKS